MNENDTPTTPPDAPGNAAPAAPAAPGNAAPTDPAKAAGGSTWRDHLPRGRKETIAAGALAGVIIAGLGFGTGYAVGDGGEPDHGPVGYSQEDGRPSGPRGDWGHGGPGQHQGRPDSDPRGDGSDQGQRDQGGTDGSRPEGDSATPPQDDTANF